EAIASFEQALRLNPQNPNIYNNLGSLYQELGQPEAARHQYARALELKPDHLDALLNAGRLALQQNDAAGGLDAFRRALQLRPDSPLAHHYAGMGLSMQDQIASAIGHFRQALELGSQLPETSLQLGLCYLKADDWRQACACFTRVYQLRRGKAWNQALPPGPALEPVGPLRISFAKLRHDLEQFRYLLGQSQGAPAYIRLLETAKARYEQLQLELQGEHPPQLREAILLTPAQAEAIEPFYGKNIYFHSCQTGSGPLVNPALDFEKINADYHSERGFAYFDDFLTPWALEQLAAFCLNSTIWHDDSKIGGYLGAYVGDGFNCPLIFLIAAELRAALPEILGNQPLIQLWGYKYDSQREGIVTHADRAIANFNFWLTPDSANLDPDTGGLLVYDVAAPEDWDFQDYNSNDLQAIARYIEARRGRTHRIPYRRNRAVLFNSALFHATDQYAFKPGYTNRRLNVTMLFGERKRSG
ncbi:MAG: tetratricopeptide repeat protein, partial [Candidatus Sericytochromatia bacterium]